MDLGSEIRDPGSGKNLFRIPDPGVIKAPDPGSGSATLVSSCIFIFVPTTTTSVSQSCETLLQKVKGKNSHPNTPHVKSRIRITLIACMDPQHCC